MSNPRAAGTDDRESSGYHRVVRAQTVNCRARLRELQGRLVGIALRGGERIDECQLISVAAGSRSVWAFENGRDIFIPLGTICDCWEIIPPNAA